MPDRDSNSADYVLGTGTGEIARLKLQHEVWQDIARQAWESGGLKHGARVLDIGCGPGFATLDLCHAAGAQGHVTAIEGSERFINAARRLIAENKQKAAIIQADIDQFEISPASHDFIWCRWVASFVNKPRRLAHQIAKGLAPGGTAAFHEYMHYGTWRILPRCESFEKFVIAVQQSWIDAGGVPDIACDLIGWLEEEGLCVEIKPRIFTSMPGEPMWNWPAAFVETNLDRLQVLGILNTGEAQKILGDWQEACGRPGIRMVTPTVAEIIARKP